MKSSKNQSVREALGRDLSPAAAKDSIQVVDDAVRKVFTAHKDGAVLVFGYSQTDAAYWNGVKHYGSGSSSRVRIRRTSAVKAELPQTAQDPVR